MATTLPTIFQQTVSRFGDRPALGFKEAGRYRTISYREFEHRVECLSAFLVEHGIGVGERVAILSENRPEWVIADQAILRIGAIDVPVYPTLIPSQVAYILNDCAASAAVVSSEAQFDKLLSVAGEIPSLRLVIVADSLDQLPDRVVSFQAALEAGEGLRDRHAGELRSRRDVLRADDLASIVYTSGTTGEPKGAMLTHGNFTSNALTASGVLPLDEHDVELSFLPLSHVFERIGFYVAMSVGATVAFAESIESLPQNLAEVRPTFLVSVPRVLEKIYYRTLDKIEHETPLKRELFYTALEIGEFFHKVMSEEGRVVFPTNVLYQAADKLVFKSIRDSLGGRLRFIVSGSAPLSIEIGRFFQVAGLPVIEGYGLTESAPILTINPPDRPKYGTVGRAIDGVTIKIAKDGEILAKGPNIMKGYWNNDEATHEALDAEGWLHTGDLGHLDDEGYLSIVDRKKELLVMSNGKKVAPQPIEARLKSHPIIEEAMLVGEGRNYMTALIVPDRELCARLAESLGLTWHTPHELFETPVVRQAIAEAVATENGGLAQFEQIKRWKAVSQPFTLETGELTPTLKLKRRVIADKFRSDIESMYHAAEEKVLVNA